MKKIFTLAIALIATIGVTNAQEKALQINRTDGTTIEFEVSRVESITYTDSPWKSLGYCLYGEDFIGSCLAYSGQSGYFACDYYVEVEENTEQPGLYRLVNPYSPDVYPWESYTTYESSKDWYIEINATNPDEVVIEYQDTGMSWGSYGKLCVYCMALYEYEKRGTSWDTIKGMNLLGTLKDGVITFPTSSLVCQLLGYSSSAYFTANSNDNFKVNTSDRHTRDGAKGVKPSNVNEKSLSINLNNLLTAEEVAEIRNNNK